MFPSVTKNACKTLDEVTNKSNRKAGLGALIQKGLTATHHEVHFLYSGEVCQLCPSVTTAALAASVLRLSPTQ
jgi:hypothetical protein